MREITFKNLTSISSRKKDIFLKEMFEKNGVTANTERRCFYFIKDIRHLPSGVKLKDWIESQDKDEEQKKRHFHILREHNDSLGEDKVICKMGGTFCMIINERVYTIGFLHSFKAAFVKNTAAK